MADFTGGPGPTFEVKVEGDPQEAETEGERLGAYIQKGLENAFAKIGPMLARELSKSLKAASPGKGLFTDLQEQSARFATAAANQTRRLRSEFEALEQRTEATRATLQKIGSDPRLFAVLDQSIANALSTLRTFDRELEEGTATPERFKQLEASLRETNKTAFRELGILQSTLKSETSAANKAAEQQRVARQQANQKALAESKQAHGKYIAAFQRETAEVLVEQRNSGRLQAQQERATQRTRLEIIKFAFGQIRALERGLSDVFGGVQTLVGRSLGGIGAITSRLTGIFKRSNRDMNDGLSGALRAREGALSRSFRSQSTSVTRELSRQSVAIERFDRQASTGVFGALTGRSRVGTALGLGAGIGGGFALFQGLKNGLQVGGDFVQGLAVLQAQLKLTDEQMQGVREQSIALGNDISLPGVSALDAAQAIQILSKQFAVLGAGALPAAQAAAKGVLQLSRATGVGAEEAARIVGAAVNVFGVSADKAVAVADQITNALTNAAGVGFDDFSDAFRQAAGVTKLFIGPSEDATAALSEFNAALAILARGGLTGANAGAGLKQFFLQANRGTKQAKAALQGILDTAGETGTLFFDAAGNARTLAQAIDILRRGTKGLSDAARASTFQNLFGSRATQVASLLAATTSQEFDRLTKSILEQGSAANIAAAQNTGLRGALDALKSVIETQQIKTYEKYQGAIGKVILKFAEMLNLFFEGVGVLGVVRDALIGVAAALSGLLVAKAAGEAISFLASSMRLLLTPLGLFVATVAILGGTINVLRTRVPAVAQALETLRATVGRALVVGLRAANQLVQQLAEFLGRYLAPVILAVANFIENDLNAALDTAIRFIENRAIPAVQRFAGFIVGTLVPALVNLADIAASRVKQGLDIARGAAVSLFDAVQPYIQPAIDGFSKLGDAIRTAFTTGDLSGVIPGLAAVGTGIGRSLANVGDAAINALKPQLQRVVAFISGFLSGKGGGSGASAGKGVKAFLIGPFQEAVAALGFFLGNLLTDPRLVVAIEKIVGLAVLTGVSFARGFLQGAISNLPKLMSDFFDQFKKLFAAGFKEVAANPLSLVKIIGALFVGKQILNMFKSAGSAGGGGFVSGFLSATRTRSSLVGNTLVGLVTGGPALQARLAAGVQKQIVGAFQAANRDIARLGGKPVNVINVAQIDRAKLAEANRQLVSLRTKFTDVGAEAIISRARIAESFSGAGTATGGFFRILSGQLKEGVVDMKVGLGRMRLAIKDAFSDFAVQAGGVGKAVGTTIGVGIMAGIGAAFAGQQLGTAHGAGGKALGLAGLIGSALLPFTTLPPEIAAPIAGLTLLIGGVTAALAHNKQAAEEARARVQAWVDALKNAPAGDRITATATKLADAVGQLDLNTQEVFRNFNFNRLAENVLRGQTSINDLFTDIASNAGATADTIAPLLDDLGKFGGKFQNLRQAAGGDPFLAARLRAFGDELAKRGVTLDQFAAAFAAITNNSTDIGKALQSVALQSTFITNPEPVQRAANATRQTADQLERIAVSVRKIPSTVPNGLGVFSNAQGVAAIAQAAANIDSVTQAIDSLNQARTDRINSQIGSITSQLDAAKSSADDALQAILDVVAPDVNNAQQALGDLIQSIPNITENLGDLLGKANKGDIQAQFGLQDIIDQFGGGLRDAVTKAITENPALTSQQLRDMFVAPIQTALDQASVQTGTDTEGNPIFRPLNAGERQFFEDQISGLFDGGLDGAIKQFQIDQATVTDLQNQLDDLNMKLPLEVTFSPFQIAAELRRLQGLGLFSGVIPTNQEIAQAQAAAVAAHTPVATSPATADSAERSANSGFVVEQINITETQNARATGDEVTRSLRAAAGSGRLIIKPGVVS